MKILFAADMHADEFNSKIPLIEEVLQEADFAVSLGDNSLQNLIKYNDLCKQYDVPAYGVIGNHDCDGDLDSVDWIIDVHNNIEIVCGYKLSGIQGSILYYPKMAYGVVMTQEQSVDVFDGLPAVDILLCHDGPYPQEDDYDHVGSKGLCQYIAQKKPKLVLHGHFHKNDTYTRNSTYVWCLYGIGVLDTKMDDVDVIWEGRYERS